MNTRARACDIPLPKMATVDPIDMDLFVSRDLSAMTKDGRKENRIEKSPIPLKVERISGAPGVILTRLTSPKKISSARLLNARSVSQKAT